jgi:hypothetical protein
MFLQFKKAMTLFVSLFLLFVALRSIPAQANPAACLGPDGKEQGMCAPPTVGPWRYMLAYNSSGTGYGHNRNACEIWEKGYWGYANGSPTCNVTDI